MTTATTTVTAPATATATEMPGNTGIWRDTERCYRAVSSRDARFDGQFIVAVRTTGIYCRPSCPAMTPKRRNVEFFPTSAAAQSASYRACRRCLPDAVPGSPEWDIRADLAGRAMRLITEGVVEREGVPGLAQRLGYSERQLGRVLTAELGAGPLALARAHRAHSARLLIEMSELPVTDIAFAAGFTSVRQFNNTIREVFASTPSQLRAMATARRRPRGATTAANGLGAPAQRHQAPWEVTGHRVGARITLRLPFRAPFDGDGMLRWLAARAIPGVEDVTDDGNGVTSYRRTLRLPQGTGIVRLTPNGSHVECALRLTDVRDLGSVVARMRRLLDLDADPEAVAQVLTADPALAAAVAANPGIRVPGSVDGPEQLMRAMLGQQVSVAAARTTAGRLAAELGEPAPAAEDGDPGLLFPSAEVIAERAHTVLRGPRRRIDAIRAVAMELACGHLDLHVGRDAAELRADLMAQPGIGGWTADYVIMRVLGQPDVLLTGDLALRKGAAALGLNAEPACLTERARTWRPWRSYAGMHLWQAAHTTQTIQTTQTTYATPETVGGTS